MKRTSRWEYDLTENVHKCVRKALRDWVTKQEQAECTYTFPLLSESFSVRTTSFTEIIFPFPPRASLNVVPCIWKIVHYCRLKKGRIKYRFPGSRSAQIPRLFSTFHTPQRVWDLLKAPIKVASLAGFLRKAAAF
jgi:hypothetical protein